MRHLCPVLFHVYCSEVFGRLTDHSRNTFRTFIDLVFGTYLCFALVILNNIMKLLTTSKSSSIIYSTLFTGMCDFL